MAKETFVTLDGASISGGKWVNGSKFTYKLEGADAVDYTVDKNGLDAITIAGLGTFKTTATDSSVVAFAADAALDGVLKIDSGANSKTSVTSLDFSKATGGISYAVDTDDTLVALGAGADTIDIHEGKATVNGYSYEDGDVISVGSGESAGYTLSNEGLFTSVGGSNSSVKVSTDGTQIYKAKATDGQASTQYWTGVAEGTANAFDASSVSDKIIIDASTSKKADVKLGSGAAAVSIGAGTVASGSNNDTITATGALTLSIGRNDGEDSVTSSIKGSDTIIFENGKLSRIDKITDTEIDYAQTTVKSATVEGAFNVQFGTDASTLGKLQWGAAGAAITADTDTTYFYGTDAKSSLTAAAAKVSYDLSDSSKFHNIHYVSLQGGTSGAVTLTNDGDTIVSAATDAALTLTLGQGADSVSLDANNKQATTIATSAVSGNDTITGFKTGFAATDDILQISDLSILDDITIGEKKGLISFDKADSISLASASFTDDGLRVKFAGSDAVKKVAADLGGDSIIAVASADADIVLGNKDGSTTYSVSGGDNADVTFFAFNDTAKYKNIHKIDLTNKKGQNIVVGTTDADTISLGAGAAAVWGGGSESDVITLATGSKGAHIWYGAGDGGDEVKGFTTDDDVYFYGVETIGDIAKNFAFSKDGTDVKVTSKNDKHDSLKLTAYTQDTLTVLTTDSKKTKVSFAGAAAANFTTDSLIYVGTQTNASVAAGAKLDDETAVYAADLHGDAGISDAKFYGINDFNASKSYAQYILIGSGESTLTGGQTKNAYWGGDSDSQTFVGQKGVTDYFWFGAGDGHDTASVVGSEDAVYLWNVDNIDDVKVTTDGTNVDVIYANENDLTLDKAVAAVKAGLTFMTKDFSEYTYDFKTQSFNKKTKA